jgi:HlyD family secretion protein
MPSRTRRGTTTRALTATAAAVAVMLVAGAVTAYASTRSDAPTYRTAIVSTQTVEQVLQSTGTIEPGSASTVSFPVSGTVASVRVVVGDRVRAGQVLASLDTTALRSAVATARAGVADAALTLHQAETGQSSSSGTGSGGGSSSTGSGSSGSGSSNGQTAAVARSQQRLLGAVHQVDQALAVARADLATAAALCGSASASPSPTATASPTAAQPAPPATTPPTTCAEAQQLVLTDETRILQLQQGVSAQEASLDRLLSTASKQSSATARTGTGSGTTTVVSAAQLAAAQADLDAAEAELAVALQNLAQAVIVSPFDGVVAAVGLTVGSTATAGSAGSAVEVIDPGTHTVSLSVDVAKIPLVKVGQKATVVPDGTGRPLPATVSYVAAAPSTSGGSSYLVRLTFGAATTGLRDGIQAAVTLIVAQVTGALSVPTSAVQHLGRLTYVTLLDAGTQKRQVVTVGAVGSLYTQVTQGLTAGQQVVLADVGAAIPTSTTNNRFARFAGAVGLGGLGGSGGFVAVPGGGRG